MGKGSYRMVRHILNVEHFLVIDGNEFGGSRGVTGIKLDNVVASIIRNITIKNCDVGVPIRSYKGLWSECNTLKHIRMENVKKGVVFTTTGPFDEWPNFMGVVFPGNSAAFTSIEDVDIGLKDVVGAVGIQIGGVQIVSGDPASVHDSLTSTFKTKDYAVPLDPNASTKMYKTWLSPYSSHIRATVRVGSNGVGFKVINGLLNYAQAHLTVIGTPNGNGVGVDLQEVYNDTNYGTHLTVDDPDRVVWHNQFSKSIGAKYGDVAVERGFVLVTSNINPLNRIKPLTAKTDIRTITL